MTKPEEHGGHGGQQPPGPQGAPQGWGQPPPTWGPPPGWGEPQQPHGYGPSHPGYPPQGGYGYGPPPQGGRTEGKAIVALVLALASFVVLPLIPAVIALVVGASARREIRASGGWLSGDGLVTAANVIAWVNIGLSVLGVLVAFAALAVFVV